MVNVEICISSDKFDYIYPSVSAALNGGATTVEFCAAMQFEGLTPMPDQIAEARRAFADRSGLMVMVRPREGNFCYNAEERAVMLEQIAMAADAGADGVVFGVLTANDQTIDTLSLHELVTASHAHRLQTTFHRAFDATPDTGFALQVLKDAGVDRVLTNGTRWGDSKGVMDGLEKLSRLVESASDTIEVVIGGGVTHGNVSDVLQALPEYLPDLSVHTHSAVMKNGLTDTELVKALVNRVERSSVIPQRLGL